MKTNLSLTPFFATPFFALACLALAASAHAAAVLTSHEGAVTVSLPGQPAAPAKANEQIPAGATVTTGPHARARLRFDDGQLVVLDRRTRFELVAYRYDAAKPSEGRIDLKLDAGALRAVPGRVGRDNPKGVSVELPQATLTVQNADFIAALQKSGAYLWVVGGTISASNDAGARVLNSGPPWSIASRSAPTKQIFAADLPLSASEAFVNLTSIPGLELRTAAEDAGS